MSVILRKILLGVFVFCTSIVSAQFKIAGKVQSEKGEALYLVTVLIKGTSLGASTDESGRFVIKNIPKGNHVIVVNYLGFKKIEKPIVINGQDVEVNFTLKESSNNLEEVTIKGKSQSEKIRETVYKPEVISLEGMKIKSTPVLNMIGRISGVVVRQTGGLGSHSNIMMNGISGKGIRTFVDGIPVDLLGSGFQLANISPNIIDRLEIYKGVIPIAFGSDALGGVVNISTKNRYTNYLDASYTTGSWNTHLATVGLKRYLDNNNHHFIQVEAAFNHSDNNYWMHNVDIRADKFGNTKKGKARRFNDAYTSYTGRFQYGVQNVSWADEFKLMSSISKIKNEYQHGVRSAEIPWGEVYGKDEDINNVISWRKRTSNKKWNFSALAGFNIIKKSFVDVASKTYLWDGTTSPKQTRGEDGFFVKGQTPITTTNSMFFRTNIGYELAANHRLNFTSLSSYERIKGEDKAGTITLLEDVYATPQKLTKNFLGLSLESNFLNNRLTNALSIKHFYANSRAATFKTIGSFDKFIDNKRSVLGYGNVVKYKINNDLSTYAGYEFAIRMPDRDEIFGNVSRIASNGNLDVEESQNINIGLIYNRENYKVNVGGFYRDVFNKIMLRAAGVLRPLYANLRDVEIMGVETSIVATPLKNLSVNANATYQNMVLRGVKKLGDIDKKYIGERIPRTPYLFANLGVSYTFSDFLKKESDFTISYDNNYVHKFYPTWAEGLSSTKEAVPTQFVHNVGLSYSLLEKKYAISLECRNFTNELAYDNFRIQKAGRSFYLKLSMYLK